MNIFVGRDGKSFHVLVFCMVFSTVRLQGAACASPNDGTVVAVEALAEDPIAMFYASKLPDFPRKFVEAACLSIARNPSKGAQYLQQQYQADVSAAALPGVKKSAKQKKEQSLIEDIRNLCGCFEQTYYREIGRWNRYKPEDTRQIVDAVLDRPVIAPTDILNHYQSDMRTLRARSCDEVLAEPLLAGSQLSGIMERIITSSEQCKLLGSFQRAVLGQATVSLPADRYVQLPNMADLVRVLKNAHAGAPNPSVFQEDLCSVAIAVTAQKLSKKPERIVVAAEKQMIVDAYVHLTDVVGEPWVVDRLYQGVTKAVLGCLALSPTFKECRLDKETVGGSVNMATLQIFLREMYQNHIEFVAQKNAYELELQHLVSADRLRGDLNAYCELPSRFVTWDKHSVQDVEQGWLQRKNMFIKEYEAAGDRVIEDARMYKEELCNHELPRALRGLKHNQMIQRSQSQLQLRYLAMLGRFAQKQQQRRDVEMLQQRTALAQQQRAINVWYRYSQLMPKVRELAAQQASLHKGIEDSACQLPLVQLDHASCAKFAPGATSSQWQLVKRYDPYFQPNL